LFAKNVIAVHLMPSQAVTPSWCVAFIRSAN